MKWKIIKDFPDYQVSSTGLIKSSKSKDKILKQSLDTRGYPQVTLYHLGKRKNLMVHKLVANAFLSNPNNYRVINHKNGNKCDNRIENLERCTSIYNNRHAFKTGIRTKKLIVKEVIEIKQRLKKGETHISIAKDYNISRVTVTNISTGKTWSYIKI